MIDIEALRKKVIDLAIRGKLTPQLPEDGDAEDLCVQIQEEKAKLIKAGKIKKEKTLPKIEDDEPLFEIPSSWKWVRVGNVAEIAGGTTPKNMEVASVGTIPFFKVSDMNTLGNETHMLHASNYITDSYSGKIFPAGTTIFPKNGGAALTNKRRLLVSPSAVDLNTGGCIPIISEMADWIRQFMDTIDFGKIDTGSNIPTVNASNLKKQLIPLPPIEEQKRIVNVIDDIFDQLDIIDALQQQYESDREILKGKIIDAGIRGELTEQLSEDGNAEDLYAQIQEEKTKLIKEGKLKKEKPLPEISDDEIPFEIPDNWMWVRVGSIFNVGTGMTPIKSESRFYVNGKIPWVNSALTSNRYIDKVDTLITDYALENTSLRLYPEHTLIVAMYGEGKTRGQISELLIPATINQACAALVSYKYREEMTRYVYYCFLLNYKRIREKAGGTSQPNLSVQKIKETIIPLPPLCEQKRIVEVIERIHKII